MSKNAFGETILNFAVNRVSDVLLNGMDESIHDATVRSFGVAAMYRCEPDQYGKHRLHERVEGCLSPVVLREMTAPAFDSVGCRPGCARPHRDYATNLNTAGFQNVPRIDAVRILRRCGDKFGAVSTEPPPTASRKVIFSSRFLPRPSSAFLGRVRFNTAKLPNISRF